MAGFNTAVTGLKSASTMLDVTGNNIANSSTTGFKSSRTEFADIYATSVVGAGSSNSAGSGVTVSDISQDFSAGTIEFTNNNLDLAINGSGFFQLDDGNGTTTYTRAGAFELDKDGNIVSKNGKYLQGYGLDAQGNILPVQNLAVNQKESAPKATENIDLSFNIDASADASILSDVFDKNDPGSYTYSTTVETIDSLGNANTIRFYMVEQPPEREVYQYDLSSLIDPDAAAAVTNGNTSAPALPNLTNESILVDLRAADGTSLVPATPVNLSAIDGIQIDTAASLETAINSALNANDSTTETENYVSVTYVGDASTGQYTFTVNDPRSVNSGASLAITLLNPGSANQDAIDIFGTTTITDVGSVTPLSVSTYELTIADLVNLDNAFTTAEGAEFRATDPRIDLDSLRYDPAEGIFSFELKAEYTQYGDLIVEGTDNSEVSLVGGEPSRRAANAVQTLTLQDSAGFITEDGALVLESDTDVTIAGVDILLTSGQTLTQIGDVIESFEAAIIDKNPDIESVVFDSATRTVDITWKAEVGKVDTIVVSSSNASDVPFTSLIPEVVEGDNSFLAQYRMYAFLNNQTALDIGKVQDPGEGTLTEVGPIRVGFDAVSGYLNMINGETVEFGATAPPIRIFGADPTNPEDQLLDNDTDNLKGIVLDITGTTQYASESIVKAAAQDGYPKGDLIGVSFAETGEMVASFSNGQRQNLGLVAIANFENQAGLQPAGDTEWIATLNSGTAILNPPGAGLNGSLRSAALESSNVDLSAELVKLIEGQRNFQANSKTLETMNTVTQAILQI